MVASAVWQHEVAYHPLWKNCGVYPPKRRWWIVPALAIITLAVLGSALQGRRSSSRRYPRQLFCVGLVGFPVRARGTAARMNPLQLESGRLGDWIGASPRDGRARKYRERPESRLRHAALRPYSAPRQGFDLAPSAFTFGDALRGAFGQYFDIPQQPMAAGVVWNRGQGSGQFPFGRREGRCGIGHKQICAPRTSRRADPITASTLSGSTDKARSKKLRACDRLSAVRPLLYRAKP